MNISQIGRVLGDYMVERRTQVEETEGEEYLHKDMWRVVPRQIAYAEASPRGALYDDLTAMSAAK